jgi:uncharacterized protein (TIGR02145 family)
MKQKIFICSIAATCLLAACGDDSSTGPSTNSSEVSQISSSSATDFPISSVTKSSDSKENSSSSQEISANSNGYPTNYNPTTGILTDERDSQIYKTAKVGNQIWMAENLRISRTHYDTSCGPTEDQPQEPDNVINKYGRYYAWITAMQLPCNYEDEWAAASTTDSVYHGPRQGICPKGWHVPSTSEWQTLLDQGPVRKLLSTEWDYSGYKGTDDYGFSLTIANEKYESFPCLQTASEKAEDENYMICFQTYSQQPVKLEHIYKHQPTYLRCLMD